ncbi:ubiquitin carboxyl-terminal hydrolase 37-like [Cloeon dipterum]|uniref:ubiquitin carboxyl-terminal hydrolase 37-like n=1 Tax=Cloeon dipterum TaxID=197152 RepID=UPI00321FF4D8
MTTSPYQSPNSGPRLPSMFQARQRTNSFQKTPGSASRKPLLASLTPILNKFPKSTIAKHGSPEPIKKKEISYNSSRGKMLTQLAQIRAPVENFYSASSSQTMLREDNYVEPHKQLADNSNLTVTLCSPPKVQLQIRRKISADTPNLTSSFTKNEDYPVAKKAKKEHIIEPHLIGFRNQGATCYMNSVLQALSSLDNFCKDVLEEMPMMSSQLCPLQSLLQERLKGNEDNVFICLRELHRRFGFEVNHSFADHNEQQDLDEFLTLYLDTIDTQIYSIRKFLDPTDFRPTLVKRNFSFEDIERRVCMSCQNERVNRQSNFLMRLSLTEEGGKKSIQQLVESGMDCSFDECSNCRNTNAVKTSRKFLRLPRTLMIILMRYNNDCQKLVTPVTIDPYLVLDSFLSEDCVPPYYPKTGVAARVSSKPEVESRAVQTDPDILEIENPDTPETDTEDMKEAINASMQDLDQATREEEEIKLAIGKSIADQDPFSRKPAANVVYRLCAVVNHYGDTPNSGHYKSDVFRKSASQWFNYNDMFVETKTTEEVLSGGEEACYLLVYEYDGELEESKADLEVEQRFTELSEEAKENINEFVNSLVVSEGDLPKNLTTRDVNCA